jgi:hypothetical protein
MGIFDQIIDEDEMGFVAGCRPLLLNSGHASFGPQPGNDITQDFPTLDHHLLGRDAETAHTLMYRSRPSCG